MTPTPTPEVKTLKIGFVGPLSGVGASYGILQRQGMQWAVDSINERGGLRVGDDTYLLKIVSYDSKMIGSEAAIGATKLAHQDKVVFSTGGVLASENTAVQPIFHEAKVIACGAGSGQCSPEFPYWFDSATHHYTWSASFDQLLKEYNPDLETIAFLHTDRPNGHASAQATIDALDRLGWTVVAEEYFTLGTTDFYPYLTTILAKNPDAIDIDSNPGDVALIVKQARELGYQGKIFNLATVQPTVSQVAGCEYAEGLQSNEPDYSSPLFPQETHNLYQEYLSRYHPEGDVMNFLVLLGYGAVMLYAQAVETAGTIDPDEVLKLFDDPNWRFEWFGTPGQKLGGLETYGIKRQVANYITLSATEDCVPVMKGVRLVEVP
ncbi:hypothetical protein ES703_41921 [subsurface metagenome]